MIVRHGGLASLDAQIRVENNLDIKKAALKVMVKILQTESKTVKETIQDEIKRQQTMAFCIN